MTPEEFAKIESDLGIRLPDWYVGSLREYPLVEPSDALFSSAEWVIRENRRIRIEGFSGNPWPREFLVIGESAAGDPVFICPSSSEKSVFFADHEIGPELCEENLPEMMWFDCLDAYIADANRGIAESCLMDEKRKSKRWWQFWL